MPGRRRLSQARSDLRIPGPFWIRQRPDERREVDVPRRRKFGSFSEAKEVIHGGPGGRRGSEDRRNRYDLGSRCRPNSRTRIPGPFWMNQRRDERREPDVGRKRRIEQRHEIPDVIHGEEARAREWQDNQNRRRENRPPINLYDLPPGPSHADPFWLLERQDERRDPDMDRKRKFRRQKIEAAEIVQGEDFRTRWDPPEEDPMEDIGDSDEDDSEAFPFKRTCKCGPAPPQGGPDRWMQEKNWGPIDHHGGGSRFDVPSDVEEEIRRPPVARVGCAPESDVSSFDQPSAFMRKLYEKYPYLHQVLAETPPEELLSKVLKDRFLSTYQVDYLHMGNGGNDGPSGGGRGGAFGPANGGPAFAGPNGEPEPEVIPGCSYRSSQKGDFGRKKQEEKQKKEKEETVNEVSEDRSAEPGVSEYMGTISKLGQEIIQDQLYAVANKVKNMKKK